jgi:hypothetical protein
MRAFSFLAFLFFGLSVIGCSEDNHTASDYDPTDEYNEMRKWDMIRKNQTDFMNQTFDNIDRTTRGMGFNTIND